LPTLEVRRRALLLFEQMLDLPPGGPECSDLFAGEPPEILAEIAALEAAQARSGGSFPTDAGAGGSVRPGERPTRLGVYRLEELIGEGGMGEVWRAERDDGLFDHRVAAKLMRPGIVSPAAEARFVDERRLLARLDHPGIARIIDGGVSEGGWPWLITELVEGCPIDEHCTAQECSLRERVTLIRQAAEAIQAAHGQLIVHADIKPGNLLVTQDGRVRLVDFGIARLIGEDGEAAPALQPMTRAYASPERLAGALPDVADDVHALGIVLGELTAEAGQDAGLAAIVARASAPAAADRYPTMEALRADLDRWLADQPVAAHPPSWRYRFERLARRHRRSVIASGLALLALALAGGFAVANHLRAESARAAEEERIADLRSVSHYLLFELQAEMARQPNSLAMRTRIAERLQIYLDRMASDSRATPLVRMEVAEGLEKLAEQQGAPGQANLGQPEQARRNLERAAGLVKGLSGERAAILRAEIGMDLSRLSIIYDHDLKRADALLQAADGEIETAGDAAGSLRTVWHVDHATLLAWQNRYEESIAAARQAMASPLPDDPRAAALLSARIADALAESTFYNGDHEGAVAPYRRQFTILSDAVKRWPADAKVRRDFARSTWALGTTLIDLGRSSEALPLLERGVAETRAMTATDRDDADAQRMLRILEVAYAQALSGVGRADEAIEVMAATIERRRAAWLAKPTEAMSQRDYAVGIAAYGDLLAQNGRTEQACGIYSEAEAMFDRLMKRGQFIEVDRDYSYRLLRESRQAVGCRA
jgi:tRNA A-37 threonylcarbamoyl transferase component Bud32/tetratricopeptide (TPR) repeat protein